MLNSFFDYSDDFFKNEFIIVLKFLLRFKDENIFIELLSKLDLDEENLVEYIKSKEAIITPLCSKVTQDKTPKIATLKI